MLPRLPNLHRLPHRYSFAHEKPHFQFKVEFPRGAIGRLAVEALRPVDISGSSDLRGRRDDGRHAAVVDGGRVPPVLCDAGGCEFAGALFSYVEKVSVMVRSAAAVVKGWW
jgi:hypothetical protein